KAIIECVVKGGNFAPALTSCPICENAKIGLFTQKYSLCIDECFTCGFRFTNPPPSSEQLRLFYNSEAKELENVMFERTRKQRLPVFERRAGLITQFMSSGTLLDIGGAIGIFVDALKRSSSSFQISVVDLNKDAVDKLRSFHPEVKAFNEDIFDHRGAYDVVTLWD